jgi:hypothetical protein
MSSAVAKLASSSTLPAATSLPSSALMDALYKWISAQPDQFKIAKLEFQKFMKQNLPKDPNTDKWFLAIHAWEPSGMCARGHSHISSHAILLG